MSCNSSSLLRSHRIIDGSSVRRVSVMYIACDVVRKPHEPIAAVSATAQGPGASGILSRAGSRPSRRRDGRFRQLSRGCVQHPLWRRPAENQRCAAQPREAPRIARLWPLVRHILDARGVGA